MGIAPAGKRHGRNEEGERRAGLTSSTHMTMNSDEGKLKRSEVSSSPSAPTYSPFVPLLLPMVVAFGLVALRSNGGATTTTMLGTTRQGGVVSESEVSRKRWLQGGGSSSSTRKFDIFFADADMCRVNSDRSVDDDAHEEDYESCNVTKFPTCQSGELICYNRRPSRSRFYNDTRQPVFFIDYRNVYCYPNSWEGCSSCSPGRLCHSEQRCIFEDDNYPCAKWF